MEQVVPLLLPHLLELTQELGQNLLLLGELPAFAAVLIYTICVPFVDDWKN